MKKGILISLLCAVMLISACGADVADKPDNAVPADIEDTEVQTDIDDTEIPADIEDTSVSTDNEGASVPIDFEALEIRDYEYPDRFELGENIEGAICIAAVEDDPVNEGDFGSKLYKENFISRYCQNSWYTNDYLQSVGGFMSAQQVEYMQYSLSGRFVDFSDVVPEEGLDLSYASSGYTTIEVEDYDVLEETDDAVTVHMVLLQYWQPYTDDPDNPDTVWDATVLLSKNPKSCFDGYSIRSIDKAIKNGS